MRGFLNYQVALLTPLTPLADLDKLLEKTKQDSAKMESVAKMEKLWDKIENALAAAEQGCADATATNLVADALAGR